MINALVGILTFRTFFVFASTAFSIALVMLFLNIITVDEIATILNMSPEAAQILKNVISRIQEVTGNVLDIISQLLTKLFSWAGVEVDLNKIKVDLPDTQDSSSSSETSADAADESDVETN